MRLILWISTLNVKSLPNNVDREPMSHRVYYYFVFTKPSFSSSSSSEQQQQSRSRCWSSTWQERAVSPVWVWYVPVWGTTEETLCYTSDGCWWDGDSPCLWCCSTMDTSQLRWVVPLDLTVGLSLNIPKKFKKSLFFLATLLGTSKVGAVFDFYFLDFFNHISLGRQITKWEF